MQIGQKTTIQRPSRMSVALRGIKIPDYDILLQTSMRHPRCITPITPSLGNFIQSLQHETLPLHRSFCL